ncbi:MAG: sphingosine kinase [Candidatus Rokuibacteriota bacterium]|nr:MAG: sphingosine kinase [Candidatus Rokubacteria bacterium]
MTALTAATPRRVLIVFNPTAGTRSRRRLHRVVQSLQQAGCIVSVETTKTAGDATSIARHAKSSGAYDVVAAAGGDGTVNETVTGLAGGMNGVSLGIIPLGTANVLAAEIGIGNDLRRAARAIATGRPRPLHIGRVNGAPFALMVGAGFDGDVVAGVTPGLKRRLGKLAYVVRGLGEWWRGGHARCRVSIDGASRDALWVVVSNTRRYGGRFVLAATADIESAEFTVTVFAAGSRLDLVRYLGALARGRVGQCRGVSVHHATKIELHGNAALQIDGDARGRLPASVIASGEFVPLLVEPRQRSVPKK